ncbi:MAG: ATPase inhibitor subunit zeta [Betaproteobacteria bacterium]
MRGGFCFRLLDAPPGRRGEHHVDREQYASRHRKRLWPSTSSTKSAAFKAACRRNKLFGLWIAEHLGLSGDAAVAYARSLVRFGPASLFARGCFWLRQRSRASLALVPVSSTNTSRVGSSDAFLVVWSRNPAAARQPPTIWRTGFRQ